MGTLWVLSLELAPQPAGIPLPERTQDGPAGRAGIRLPTYQAEQFEALAAQVVQ